MQMNYVSVDRILLALTVILLAPLSPLAISLIVSKKKVFLSVISSGILDRIFFRLALFLFSSWKGSSVLLLLYFRLFWSLAAYPCELRFASFFPFPLLVSSSLQQHYCQSWRFLLHANSFSQSHPSLRLPPSSVWSGIFSGSSMLGV